MAGPTDGCTVQVTQLALRIIYCVVLVYIHPMNG